MGTDIGPVGRQPGELPEIPSEKVVKKAKEIVEAPVKGLAKEPESVKKKIAESTTVVAAEIPGLSQLAHAKEALDVKGKAVITAGSATKGKIEKEVGETGEGRLGQRRITRGLAGEKKIKFP